MDTSTFQLGKYLSVSQIILFFSLSLFHYKEIKTSKKLIKTWQYDFILKGKCNELF